jgi:hypothetical protein
VKLTEEYTRLMEKKRADGLQARVDRQHKLMERMEDTVIKEQSKKAKEASVLLACRLNLERNMR